MSLTVDGTWKAGVWATTVWANGVWREGTPTPTPTPTPTFTGGAGTRGGQGKRIRFWWEEPERPDEVVTEPVVELREIPQPGPYEGDVPIMLRTPIARFNASDASADEAKARKRRQRKKLAALLAALADDDE